MSDEQSTIEPTSGPGVPEHAAAIDDTAVRTPEAPIYDPLAEDNQEWDEPLEELPRRPRRRFLGAGGNPIFLALFGVLLIACGFIGGVLVEKGQSTASSSGSAGAAGLASRFAALRSGGSAGATSGTSAGAASAGGSSGGSTSTGGGGFFGRSGGGAASAGGAGTTAGQVAYLSGDTLYVSTAEGNTVKVTTSPASTITKTVKAEVKGIHPGETVLVTGTAGKNGAISAESIRVGAGGESGGLGALFGASGAGGGERGGTGASATGSGASTGGGEPALFGKGG